ncbi:MAG: hypothetical protein ACOYLG_10460 [Chitinophagaceae bacterium]
MEEEKIIQFQLIGIKTVEFATFEQDFVADGEFMVNTNLNYSFHLEDKVVIVNAKFIFLCNEKPVIAIAVNCYFNLRQWDEYYSESEQKLTLPKNLAQHIAVITIGTTRGVLHTKTEGTLLNSLLLPSINVLELVPNDIIIGGK